MNRKKLIVKRWILGGVAPLGRRFAMYYEGTEQSARQLADAFAPLGVRSMQVVEAPVEEQSEDFNEVMVSTGVRPAAWR